MALWGWFRRNRSGGDGRLTEWRQAWRVAAGKPDPADVASLTARLDAIGLPDDDVEIEREMLEGLDQLIRLTAIIGSNGLPILETGHRIVGADTCHYSAPASMPDDPTQPAGRLILTSARAIFAGGARATTLPWHAVSTVVQQDRDIVLVRHDRETMYRFRCNLFADAMCAAFLARRLSTNKRKTDAK